MKRVLMVAGASGGHIFPALEIAKGLTEKKIEVLWLGSGKAIEKQLIAPHFKLFHVPAKKLRNQSLFGKLWSCSYLLVATLKSALIMWRTKPQLVIVMGSYVAGPGGLAAKLLRIPLVVHEQNAIPGLANHYLAKIAQLVLQTYPNTFPTDIKTITTGNPVRKAMHANPKPDERYQQHQGPLRILVLGGSQGSQDINVGFVNMLREFPAIQQLSIRHQCGKNKVKEMEAAYQNLTVDVQLEPFIDDMLSAYLWADLLICRSGASTLAEITAIGIASILIPYPYQVNDHQLSNAKQLATVGAALIIAERTEISSQLSKLLPLLIDDRKRLLVMANAAQSLAHVDATEKVVAECINIM